VDGLFPRTLSKALRRVAGPYPVFYITGPRQSGKTTLARTAFPDFAYVNLEDLQRPAAVKGDPHGLLRSVAGGAGVIVDEAQRVPERSRRPRRPSRASVSDCGARPAQTETDERLSRAACSGGRDRDSVLSLAMMDVAWASEYEARVIETVPWGAPPREIRGRPSVSEGGSP
jgi:hypothetical protein